jgi:cupin fold WbuC family metalloprotein
MSTQTTPAIQLISGALFDSVTALASASRRRRMNHNFHSGAGDNPHRFLNVLMLGTYIRPHRHSVPPKTESFVVLEGAADVIIFDESGAPTNRYRLGTETRMAACGGSISPPASGTQLWREVRVPYALR